MNDGFDTALPDLDPAGNLADLLTEQSDDKQPRPGDVIKLPTTLSHRTKGRRLFYDFSQVAHATRLIQSLPDPDETVHCVMDGTFNGIMLGAYTSTTEFVLFCRRGTLKSLRQVDTTWWNWPRHNKHSKKPEHFQDIVETVSPGPYLELFARRKRLGWHAWGNEVPCDVNLVTPNIPS